MNCMKCGRETPEGQSFCEDCLIEMEKYPVRPGTVVQLPQRREPVIQRKAPKRRSVPLEEQVKILKKRLHFTSIALLVAVLLSIALAFPAVEHFMEDHFAIGQNYSSVTATTGTNGN